MVVAAARPVATAVKGIVAPEDQSSWRSRPNRLSRELSPHSSTQIINLCHVKSSQVKSSSNFNGGRARRLWGARRRERSGGRGAAQLAWLDSRIDSPEPGLYAITGLGEFSIQEKGNFYTRYHYISSYIMLLS